MNEACPRRGGCFASASSRSKSANTFAMSLARLRSSVRSISSSARWTGDAGRRPPLLGRHIWSMPVPTIEPSRRSPEGSGSLIAVLRLFCEPIPLGFRLVGQCQETECGVQQIYPADGIRVFHFISEKQGTHRRLAILRWRWQADWRRTRKLWHWIQDKSIALESVRRRPSFDPRPCARGDPSSRGCFRFPRRFDPRPCARGDFITAVQTSKLT